MVEENHRLVIWCTNVGEGSLTDENTSLDNNETTFENNTAGEGGAIVFDSLITTVRNSRFERNIATVTGGALATTNIGATIASAALSRPRHGFVKLATTISHCEFNGNIARGDQVAHDGLV